MKKINASLKQHRFVLCLLLFSSLFIHSCKKDREAVAGNTEITALKNWYNAHAAGFNQSSKTFAGLTPNFDRSYTAVKDGLSVTEIEFSTANRLIFTSVKPDDKTAEQLCANTAVKLVFFNKGNQDIGGAYMVVTTQNGKLNEIHYKDFANLTGTIRFYNLDGSFQNGYGISNGKISSILSIPSKANLNLLNLTDKLALTSAKQGLGSNDKLMLFDANGGCNITVVNSYTGQCVSIKDHPDLPPVCTWEVSGADIYMTCDGGSGSDTGGTGGGYTGTGDAGPGGSGSGLLAPTKQQIEDAIKDKPFAFLKDVPCEILKAWLATAKFTPSSSIIDKLNTLKNSGLDALFFGEKIARIQKIDDASSPIINMDYFPVNISQLPIVNGQRLSPDQFIHYLRVNLDAFTNGTKTFMPYNNYGIDDREKWNSNDPEGSILALDITGPENASVITSKSTSNGWTFTTIYEPMYGDHPVSGHRDFGYTANVDGSYTFFTRGVDRLTNVSGDIMEIIPRFFGVNNGIPFSQADGLWNSLQSGIKAFVTSHGGKATIQSSEIIRPNWDLVKEVMEGKKPLSALSKDCPD